jgi:hypothetical protein
LKGDWSALRNPHAVEKRAKRWVLSTTRANRICLVSRCLASAPGKAQEGCGRLFDLSLFLPEEVHSVDTIVLIDHGRIEFGGVGGFCGQGD